MDRSKSIKQLNRVLNQPIFRLVQHLLFWAAAYFALLILFAYNNRITFSDHLYTGLFLLSIGFLVYINLYLLIDRLFAKGRIWWYLIGIVLSIIASIGLNLFTFEWLCDWLFPSYYFIAYFEWFDLFLFMISFWGLSTLLRFSKSWFRLAETEDEIKTLEQERLNAELQALRAQINPHFLFNSLNSVYSMAIEQETETPETILKLSNLLRYMLYDTQANRVPMQKELDHIGHFIDLQKLRAEAETDITFKQKGDFGSIEIAPLLLIPLVENGFKYGIKAARGNVFIHIFAKAEKEYLHFEVKNNKGSPDQSIHEDVGGIGLKNVKRRLELIYPKTHDLIIHESETSFMVKLKIKHS